MAVITNTSGVFPGVGLYGSTGLLIPLADMEYGAGALSSTDATGDYRAVLRAVHQTYYNFMTGTATGADGVFQKPSYFEETRSSASVVNSTKIKRSYTSSFWYDLSDPIDLPLEPE